jgi:hypothetical protein
VRHFCALIDSQGDAHGSGDGIHSMNEPANEEHGVIFDLVCDPGGVAVCVDQGMTMLS